MKKSMMVMLASATAALMYSQVRNGNVEKAYKKVKKEVNNKLEEMM